MALPSRYINLNKNFSKSINLLFIFADIYSKTNQGGDYMLVLGRKPGEYVVIDDKIIVKVVKSEAGDLRLAIDAPKDVPIVRGEVYERNKNIIDKTDK
jgi:carbon storage regulator